MNDAGRGIKSKWRVRGGSTVTLFRHKLFRTRTHTQTEEEESNLLPLTADARTDGVNSEDVAAYRSAFVPL